MDTTTIDQNGQPSAGRNKLSVGNLSDKQKQALKAGGLAAAGIGLGAGIFGLYSMMDPLTGQAVEPSNLGTEGHSATSEKVEIYTDAPVAESVTDDMKFGEAFQTAREEVGPGGFFMWHDKPYGTYYKDEWDSMSTEEKNEFYASVDVPKDPEEGAESEVEGQALAVDGPNVADAENTDGTNGAADEQAGADVPQAAAEVQGPAADGQTGATVGSEVGGPVTGDQALASAVVDDGPSEADGYVNTDEINADTGAVYEYDDVVVEFDPDLVEADATIEFDEGEDASVTWDEDGPLAEASQPDPGTDDGQGSELASLDSHNALPDIDNTDNVDDFN